MTERPCGFLYKRRTRQRMPGDAKGKRTGPVREHPFWWIGYNGVDGKLHRESTHSADRRKAERLLAKRLAEVDLGSWVDPAAKKMKFDELMKLVVTDYELNGYRSLKRLNAAVENLKKFFGGYKVMAITTARMKQYATSRQEDGVANSTIRYELRALSRALTLAVEDMRLPRKPKIPSIKVDNARKGFFEWDQFKRLLKHLPHYLRPVMQFAFYTGWRIPSEVLTLTWWQVDIQAGVVRLEPGTTKNDEGREFPFTALPALESVLREQREWTDALEKKLGRKIQWVFHREGEPIKAYRRAWVTACKKALLVGMIPHDLRRTAVRNLERAGVSRSAAMKLTGHKTEAVYRRYAIVAESDLREGAAKLTLLHGGKEHANSSTEYPEAMGQ
jgi:integrase